MKKIKNILTAILFFSLFANLFGFEKTGTTSFQFLKVIPTARAAAMAGAYSSISASSDAIFWNPAGLTSVENLSASVGYADWFMDVMHYSFSAAYNIEGIGTVGILGMVADYGEIEVTSVEALGFSGGEYNPGLTGEIIKPGSSVFGLSFAKYLNDRFAFGLTVKYAMEDLVYEKAGSIIFDGGLTYDTDFRSIILSASLRNFGPEVTFVDRSYPLPQTLNIGISSYLIAPDNSLLASISNQSLLISYDIIQPRDYDQQHSIGIEYSFNDLIFLRGGYLFNSDQEGLSFGGGINIQNYQIDYAYNQYGEYLDDVHRITIGFNFN